MDLEWNDERTRQFVTNVGLVTSNGPHGHNIMACEWTHHVSYLPSLIVINIHERDATAENIMATREFGVSLASESQNIISSVAGGSTGKDTDKIAALKKLGYEFYEASKIKALMVKGAAMNVECVVKKTDNVGDHLMIIGKVVEISADTKIKPILYHQGKYWKLGENVERPSESERERIRQAVERHAKGQQPSFNSSLRSS